MRGDVIFLAAFYKEKNKREDRSKFDPTSNHTRRDLDHRVTKICGGREHYAYHFHGIGRPFRCKRHACYAWNSSSKIYLLSAYLSAYEEYIYISAAGGCLERHNRTQAIENATKAPKLQITDIAQSENPQPTKTRAHNL